jgi:gamma-glutamyltranspeptidase
MTMDAGDRIYAPGGRLLEAGDTLQQPGLVAALETLAAEGSETFYSGTIAEALLALVDQRGGLVTHEDLVRVRARSGRGRSRRRTRGGRC